VLKWQREKERKWESLWKIGERLAGSGSLSFFKKEGEAVVGREDRFFRVPLSSIFSKFFSAPSCSDFSFSIYRKKSHFSQMLG
jgi:hypothetical protein